jgi:hypothetical protein
MLRYTYIADLVLFILILELVLMLLKQQFNITY